jgi:hypothetical protein
MARTQSAAKVETPAAVKAAARAPRVHKAKPGTVEGPKGKPLEQPTAEHNIQDEQRQGERRQASTNAVANFTQTQMQTPAVHATPDASDSNTEAIKQKAFLDAMQALASSMGVDPAQFLNPAPGKVKAARADKQQRNGITRPAPDTATGKIWAFADEISAKKAASDPNAFASIAELRQVPELRQTNEHTLKTQYARWRSYNGLKGRAEAAPAPTPNRRADDPKPETTTAAE